MNKNAKIGLGAVVALAALGGAWAMMGGEDAPAPTPRRDSTQVSRESTRPAAPEAPGRAAPIASTDDGDDALTAPTSTADVEEELTADPDTPKKKTKKRGRRTPRKANKVEEKEYEDDFQEQKKKRPPAAR